MIDEIDQKLIKELQRNGRESYLDLAKILGVVEGTVRKRVKRLMEQDIVKIVAMPNVSKLGYSLISVVGLQCRVENLRAVAENMAKNSHVCFLAFVTGRYDLLAIVMTRSSQELSHLIEKEIWGIPNIVRTETFITLDIIKGERGILDTAELVGNLDTCSPGKKSNKSRQKRSPRNV